MAEFGGSVQLDYCEKDGTTTKDTKDHKEVHFYFTFVQHRVLCG